MRILINDANIFIDLVKLELLVAFSNLSFDLHTTDFVIEELNGEQQVHIIKLSEFKRLNVIETNTIEDFLGINGILENSNGLSFEDCSVWYYSKKLSGVLLTGDGKLRKLASKDDIEVRGVIYLFDEFLIQNLISFEEAVEKIKQLRLLNNRLPKKEIEKRIDCWKQNNHIR